MYLAVLLTGSCFVDSLRHGIDPVHCHTVFPPTLNGTLSPMAMTVFNALFLAAFILSAAVQYNDPDALLWIAVYLAAAVLCIAQLRGRLWRWAPFALLAVCLLWIGSLLPSVVGKVSPQEIFESITMRTRAVEQAREIGGLALVALWCTVAHLHRGP